MSKIQPMDQIGPNNAGKMILRGCFMNVSQPWLEETSGRVGELLSNYLDNRHEEATNIKLNYGEGIPSGREEGPDKIDIDFMTSVISKLKALEKSGAELNEATEEDIYEQVTEQIIVIEQEIKKYKTQCIESDLELMFTGAPSVIIENVKSRDAVTHAQSMKWEDIDLFEGMTIHNESTYEPPTFSPK
ncbi:hypothetical protein [Legionella resiliens]|uniref:Uncharacterized protein n=1 Tax=Legionella resiliens TaxID=2905958 RepID=A0ABS8X5D9_9GAMM|nr:MULTISPECIES: hypothetical protein [unclassified Legionella]MCE0724026.1 hypothetical protein [Legionella sp. 9fVS26]MCE3533179.1 hypothetical protein [Legionella sp. 8cVS16]